nr:unnamed protein product [Callosobruchus chinensis]
MTRLEGQRQAVSQILENQDKRITSIEEQLATSQKYVEEQLQQVRDLVTEMFRELSTGELSLTAVVPALCDRHSSVVAKPYPYDDKTS